jgi:type III secretion protein J
MGIRSKWALGALLASALLLGGCQKASLLEGLNEQQANEVVAVMLHNNITAHKRNAGKTGYAVEVADADLAQAVDLVRENALPSPVRTQVGQAFPADAMISTPLGERARLYSIIEQRLEESLSAMTGVRKAHVDISYDLRTSTGMTPNQVPDGMRLAAVVVHEPGVDEQVLLQSVKRFLRNTFANVEYENISVILSVATPTRALAATPQRTTVGPQWWSSLVWVGFIVMAGLGALALIRRHGREKSAAWVQGVTGRFKMLPKPKASRDA